MIEKEFQGVYAAVLSPRLPDGALDLVALRALLRFLDGRGITRFAVNGATGEFCLTTPQQLRLLLSTVRAECGLGAEILCGVGAAGLAGTETLVQVAADEGAQGLLLPMPHFFPYAQHDLDAFCRQVAAGTSLPVLLYNLPQFTTGMDVETVCDLVDTVPNIAGVKDSSGALDTVAALTERLPHACRIIGNDSALAGALTDGLCDGVVSGVACVLPELICALYRATPGSDAFDQHCRRLEAFIEQLNVFPTPWGLKWAAEERGILQAGFSLPLSDRRRRQASEFRAWLCEWLPAANTTR